MDDIDAINKGAGILLKNGRIVAPSGRIFARHPGKDSIYPESGPDLVGVTQAEFDLLSNIVASGGMKGNAVPMLNGLLRSKNPGFSDESVKKLMKLYETRRVR